MPKGIKGKVSKGKQYYIDWAKAFKVHFGYFPARADLKGDIRQAFIKHYNYPMEHATTIERLFSSWSDFRVACGEAASIYTPTRVAEDISMAYMVNKYGMVPNESEQGVVDGYIGDRAVEVKGAIIRAPSSTNRLRWITHNRNFDNLVDEVYFIGVDTNSQVIVEICVPTNTRATSFINNVHALQMTGKTLTNGYSSNPLWSYVVAYVPQ